MASRFIAILGLGLSLVPFVYGAAEAAAPPIPAYRLTIVVKAETVLAPDELFVYCCAGSAPSLHGGNAWEIRTADETRRIATVPLDDPHFATEWPLGSATINRIGPLPDGNYLIAWTIDGRRVSNVAPFRIDSQYDPSTTPPLSLSQMEPANDREFPRLILRAFRLQKQDPAPLNEEIMYPLLSFDGQVRGVEAESINGMDEPLAVGTSYAYPLDVSSYTWLPEQRKAVKPLQLGKPYSVFALVGKDRRKSNSITISYGHPLAASWDTATPTIKPAQLPAVTLRGTVIGPDGKPAPEYAITVLKETSSDRIFREISDSAGEFEYRSLPPGTYDVSTGTPFGSQAKLTVRNVLVSTHGIAKLSLDFRQSFHIRGRVSRADGTPAASQKISSEWISPDGTERYDACAYTDAAGRYAIGSPFKSALYLYVVNGHSSRGRVDAGQEVNFILGDQVSR